MLVITRKLGQSVLVGDDIKITLMEIKGAQVRLGISAPSNVRIYREEVYSQIMNENKLAASTSDVAQRDIGLVFNAWTSKTNNRD